MPRLLKVTALLLATLWLPATLHCTLERLGLDTLFACAGQPAETDHNDSDGCIDDGCQTIESGQVMLAKVRLDAALPTVLACVCHFCLFELRPLQPAPEFLAARQDETLHLRRTWQFDRRAAAPPRAPGLNA